MAEDETLAQDVESDFFASTGKLHTTEDGDWIRPPRRPLLPAWIPLAALGVVLIVALAVGLAVYLSKTDRVTVPRVIGLDKDVALARLAQGRLAGEITETRFDPAPAGTVISQDPAPDVEVEPGARVSIVVSAGSEQVTMPDVVGESLALATSRLESLGLVVDVEYVEDTTVPKDTVLYTNPIQGAVLNTSDTVLLAVAAERDSTPSLMPFLLDDTHVIIDPAPVPTGSTDLPLRISSRLQSLLEAAGAEVTVTRTSASTNTSEDTRAEAAVESTGAVLALGLGVEETGPAGMTVSVILTEQTSPFRQSAEALASDIVRLLAEDGRDASVSSAEEDKVLGQLPVASLRIRLGSLAADADASLFRDPAASDKIAERLYRAIGERLGTPQ